MSAPLTFRPSEMTLMRDVRDRRRAALKLLAENGSSDHATYAAMCAYHVAANALRARYPRNRELYENGNGGDPT